METIEPAWLEELSERGGCSPRLLERATVIGRSGSVGLAFEHPSVSRRHAELIPGPARTWTLRDLSSRNGTTCNGVAIRQCILRDRDIIGIGDVRLRFSTGGAGVTVDEGEDAPGFTIESIPPSMAPRLSADHVTAILQLGRALQDSREPSNRLRQLLDLLVAPEFAGLWSYALKVSDGTGELQIAPLAAPGTSSNGQNMTPHISRNVLRAVLAGREPVVANRVSRVEKFHAEFSIASDASLLAAVACPLGYDDQSVSTVYVILPPAFGTLEWLMLVTLAVEQYRHAGASWGARQANEARAAFDREMALARAVQTRTLPRSDAKFPLDWAVRFEPCYCVGGDYVDVLTRPDGTVLLVIADVVGKGMQAALITSSLHAVLQTLAAGDSGLEQIIAAANRYLSEFLSDGSFVTLCAIALDPASGEGACVNCGHPPVVALDRQIVRTIAGGRNLPLGLCSEAIESQPFRLEKEEWLIGYTDGLSETFNSAHEMLGTTELHQHFAAINSSPLAGADELADKITLVLDTFRGSATILDDRTFFIAKLLEPTHL